MPEHAYIRPAGSAFEATRHRFGTRRLRELLAARGDAGLWLAEDDDGVETLLRLYPGLPTMEEWHALDLEASQRAFVVDPRLVSIEEIGLDVWPHLSFGVAEGESLARRIAREPLAPEAAVAVCADVTVALAALERAGVPPVDVSPADVVLVGERARLLGDVGLPGGTLAHVCVDRGYVAPERAAALAEGRRGVRAALRGAAAPTTESMTYALASIVAAAIQGPSGTASPARAAPSAQLERVLRTGLAQRPSERYATPAALVEALGEAVGVHLLPAGVSARATRTGVARAAVGRRRTRPRRRSVPFVTPAVVLLVAAAIGTVAGLPTSASDPPAAGRLAGAGISVEAPRGWLRDRTGEGVPPIEEPAFVAHPPGQSRTTALVVTRAAAPLLARLADAVPEAVRLGDYDAWRYRDVALGDGSVADVYVLEDGDGTIVAACLEPSGAPIPLREECSAALTTLRLDAGRAAALGGDAGTRRQLARIVEDLDRARASERRALAAATSGRRQAAAAGRLAAVYARSAAGAKGLGPVGAPGDLSRLVKRLGETGRAYAALATAARATHRAAYARARERVVAHERALHDDLAALAPASSTP